MEKVRAGRASFQSNNLSIYMDSLKLENFKREHPNMAFPRFRTLSLAEARKVEQIVRDKMKMPPNTTSLDLIKLMRERSEVIRDANAECGNFELKSILSNRGFSNNGQVLVNWNRFDQIDEVSLDDLSTHFDDIWYPATDDIDIIDNSFSWVISVGYSGEVTVLKLH